MKKCEHIKNLILTDYIDGELDHATGSQVETHLLDCNDCRVFFREVRNMAVLPLQQRPVPAELWGRIKKSIEEQPQSYTSPWEEWLGQLKGWFVFPRLVPVAVSLMLMIFVGSMSLDTIQLRTARDKDQGEYLVSLLGPAGSSPSLDSNELGTPIEHYFL